MTRQATRVAILILGTADWNQQIATNQHYMTRELAAIDGARVWFTESLGLRKPELRVRDMRRVAHRVFGKSRGGSTGERRPVPDNVHIISPLVAPYHGISTATINRLLLSRSVREWLRSPGEKVLWSYSPVTYGLEKYADVSYYHCVDLLDTIPGIDAGVIRRNEARLASHRHVRAIASSDVVKKHLESRGFIDPVLWENVADVSRFGTPAEPDVAAGEARIIFAGNLAPNKVNFELLTQLAERGLHVSLAGPLAEGGGDVANQMDRLLASGCRYLGSLSIDELSDALAASSIGLIPYLQNDYTRGVSPLKTFEYLASGLQVVATPIPGVHASERDVVVVEPARFVDTVMRLASANRTLADVQRRRQIAEQHSWHQRGADARALVRGDLERRRNTTRVAVVAHADVWGGAERYLCELYSRLGDTVQTELVGAIPNWPPSAGPTADARLSAKWSRKSMLLALPRAPRELRRVERMVAAWAPDVIHMQYKREQIVFTRRLSRIAPVIWTEHGTLPQRSLAARALMALYRAASSHASAIICVSSEVAHSVTSVTRHSRVTVVENAIDSRAFAPASAQQREAAREVLGIDQEVPLALWVARLHPGKLPELAVRIGRHWHGVTIIAGDGPSRSEIEAAARTSPRVRVVGHVADTRELYAAADLMMFTSAGRGEGYPTTTILEASAMDLPIITHRSSGAGDVVEAVDGGVVEEADDITSWLTGMDEVRSRSSSARRAEWVAQHSTDQWTLRHADIIAEVRK